jgi:hypothetical protein
MSNLKNKNGTNQTLPIITFIPALIALGNSNKKQENNPHSYKLEKIFNSETTLG